MKGDWDETENRLGANWEHNQTEQKQWTDNGSKLEVEWKQNEGTYFI